MCLSVCGCNLERARRGRVSMCASLPVYVCVFLCVCVCPPEKESWADSCFCRQAWQAEALLFIVMLDGGTYQP